MNKYSRLNNLIKGFTWHYALSPMKTKRIKEYVQNSITIINQGIDTKSIIPIHNLKTNRKIEQKNDRLSLKRTISQIKSALINTKITGLKLERRKISLTKYGKQLIYQLFCIERLSLQMNITEQIKKETTVQKLLSKELDIPNPPIEKEKYTKVKELYQTFKKELNELQIFIDQLSLLQRNFLKFKVYTGLNKRPDPKFIEHDKFLSKESLIAKSNIEKFNEYKVKFKNIFLRKYSLPWYCKIIKTKCESYIITLDHLKNEFQNKPDSKYTILLKQIKSDVIKKKSKIEALEKDCTTIEQELNKTTQLIENIPSSQMGANKEKISELIKSRDFLILKKDKLFKQYDLLEQDLNQDLCKFYDMVDLKLDEIEKTIKYASTSNKLSCNEHLLSQAKRILIQLDKLTK